MVCALQMLTDKLKATKLRPNGYSAYLFFGRETFCFFLSLSIFPPPRLALENARLISVRLESSATEAAPAGGLSESAAVRCGAVPRARCAGVVAISRQRGAGESGVKLYGPVVDDVDRSRLTACPGNKD